MNVMCVCMYIGLYVYVSMLRYAMYVCMLYMCVIYVFMYACCGCMHVRYVCMLC